MKHSDLVRIAAPLMQAHENFGVIGSPGVGKTEALIMAAEIALGIRKAGHLAKLKRNRSEQIVVTHPVIMEEVDFRGLPGFETDAHGQIRAVFRPFGFLREICCAEGPDTIVILDDLPQARLSVQGASMQMVHLREIDGQRVRDNVTFCWAGNRREDRAGVQGLNAAFLDRSVCVLQLEHDADELGRWLVTNGYPSILAAFVRWKPNAIRFDAKNEFEKCSTPRSIAGLGRLLNMGLDAPEVCGGATGPAFASEFLAYRKVELSLVSAEDILKAPEKVKIPEDRGVLFAIMSSLAEKLNVDTLAQGVKFLDRVSPEFAVMVMKDVVAKIPDVQDVPAFAKWARANAKLLGM